MMNYCLTVPVKRVLSLAQLVFMQAREGLTAPICTMSSALPDNWLSEPSGDKQKQLEAIIRICMSSLPPSYGPDFCSKDCRYSALQHIQLSLSELIGSEHNAALDLYLSVACSMLAAIIAMDAAYKSSIRTVDELAHAKDIAITAEKEARKLGANIVVAILDKSAQLVLLHRMHGAILISTDVAIEKARSAVLMQMPSGSIRALVQQGAEFEGLQNTRTGICVLDGGFPMYAGSRLIGGIGISGASASQDIQIGMRAVTENFLSIAG